MLQTGSPSPTITTAIGKRKRDSSTTETLTLTLVPPLDSSSEVILTRLKNRLSESLADEKSDIGARRRTLVAFAKKINEAQRVLDDLVDDYSGNRDDGSCVGKRVNVSDIISYSRKISYTTFAPPGLGSALPPAPQEDQMRASRLFQASSLIQLQPQPQPQLVSHHPSGGPQEEQMRASPLVSHASSLIQPQVVRHPSGDPQPRKPTRVVPYVQLDITQDDDDDDSSYTSSSSDDETVKSN